jgi:hypothetical protein
MSSNTLNKFNIANLKILLGIVLSISFLPSYAIDNPKLSDTATELNNMLNNPKYKNDSLNNQQNQNDTELVMFILKAIEEKKIQDPKQKIAFANSFQVSDDIKSLVRTQINQKLNYSDNEKVSYGVYILKNCAKQNVSTGKQVCYVDRVPRPAPSCPYLRSNVCCRNESL